MNRQPSFSRNLTRPNGNARTHSLRRGGGMFVVALACLLPAGCSGKVVDLGASREKLDECILQSSDKPLLVDFWKFGCASCMSLEPVMDKLAQEYDGRVTVARFFMDHLWFEPTDWEVFKRYGFGFFPTVILFVNGQEQHRWVWDLEMKNYHEVLQPLVGPPTTQPATQPATRPSSEITGGS